MRPLWRTRFGSASPWPVDLWATSKTWVREAQNARHPKLLARASAYLEVHRRAPNPQYDAYVSRGLATCESVKRKPE